MKLKIWSGMGFLIIWTLLIVALFSMKPTSLTYILRIFAQISAGILPGIVVGKGSTLETSGAKHTTGFFSRFVQCDHHRTPLLVLLWLGYFISGIGMDIPRRIYSIPGLNPDPPLWYIWLYYIPDAFTVLPFLLFYIAYMARKAEHYR